ncbi:MAG: hypothetical protein IK121_07205, partial [Lachnospiraceae bacterium]|nr:hypothetical protein [Lachnospiraceae bacterium]
MSKKRYIPTAEYYFYILLSVIDICVGGFCAIRLGLNILDGSAFNKVPATFNTGVVNRFHITPIVWNVIYIFAIVLCVIAYPFVSRKRQELRDKVEYDENGVSRKHGSFSQLSKAERDAIEQQKMIDMERILPSSLVKSITHIGSEHPEEDLERLIGLSVVKEEVKRMVSRMEFEQGNHKHKNGETHT